MKKVLKIILYIFLGIIAFGLILGAFGTMGLKEVKNVDIESIDLSQIEDGQYTGEYKNARWTNEVIVTVKDHKITDIEHTKSNNSAQIEVFKEIIENVINEQTVDIDTVSGATATTNSLLKAIEDALN